MQVNSQFIFPSVMIINTVAYLESQPFWFFKQNVLKLVASASSINMAALTKNITKSNEDIER